MKLIPEVLVIGVHFTFWTLVRELSHCHTCRPKIAVTGRRWKFCSVEILIFTCTVLRRNWADSRDIRLSSVQRACAVTVSLRQHLHNAGSIWKCTLPLCYPSALQSGSIWKCTVASFSKSSDTCLHKYTSRIVAVKLNWNKTTRNSEKTGMLVLSVPVLTWSQE